MSPVDLSRDAIAHRRQVKTAGGPEGGYTGRQLIDAAARVFRQANRLRKVAEGRSSPGRRRRADEKADEALKTAAAQIRVAQQTPLDRPHLHHLDLHRLQDIFDQVRREFNANPLNLALDTNTRIQDQRQRQRAEGATT